MSTDLPQKEPSWSIGDAVVQQSDRPGTQYLEGCARAIGFVRFAASGLNQCGKRGDAGRLEAGYHAYAGISVIRTALDAAAGWLNTLYGLYPELSSKVSFARSEFIQRLTDKDPQIAECVKPLGKFAREWVSKHRNIAQHEARLTLQLATGSVWAFSPSGEDDPDLGVTLWILLLNWVDLVEDVARETIEILRWRNDIGS